MNRLGLLRYSLVQKYYMRILLDDVVALVIYGSRGPPELHNQRYYVVHISYGPQIFPMLSSD